MLKATLTVPLILFSLLCYSQSIDHHRWSNRILLVLGDRQNEHWNDQLSLLKACEQELQERKIIIYLLQPARYKVVSNSWNEASWQASSKLYERFKKSDQAIETVLVGLDGGIKLRRDDTVSCELLNAVIDQMPMRRAEIRAAEQFD